MQHQRHPRRDSIPEQSYAAGVSERGSRASPIPSAVEGSGSGASSSPSSLLRERRGREGGCDCGCQRSTLLMLTLVAVLALVSMKAANDALVAIDMQGRAKLLGAAAVSEQVPGEEGRVRSKERRGRSPRKSTVRSGHSKMSPLRARGDKANAWLPGKEIGAAEEPNELSPEETLEKCRDWVTQYAIVPEESWGSAPKEIQQDWLRKECDRLLAEVGFSYGDPPTRGRSRVVIVVWTPIRGWLEYLRLPFVKKAREECPTECIFTSDRARMGIADAVFFHIPTHADRVFPERKPAGAKYVMVNLEPETHKTVKHLLGDKKYMSKFDLSMTYRLTSDLPLGYVSGSPASRYFQSTKLSFAEKDGFGEPGAIAAFISNCKLSGASERTKYMGDLMQHAVVHSFGKCHHNREEPVLGGMDGATNRQQNKVQVSRRYKFLLAFENNNQLSDYVTEKVYNGLEAGTLPVYWGASNIDAYVPRGSVVKASDFAGPAELAQYLEMLAQDEEAYESYFEWRRNATEAERFQKDVVSHSAYSVNAMCRLCDRLARDRGSARAAIRSW